VDGGAVVETSTYAYAYNVHVHVRSAAGVHEHVCEYVVTRRQLVNAIRAAGVEMVVWVDVRGEVECPTGA
jgi:hypothetical protein